MRLLICEERDADDAGHAMRESSRWSLNEEERPVHGGALVQTGSCNLTTDDGSRLRSPRRSAPSPPILTSVCCSESSLMHRKCRLSGPRTGGYQLSSSSSCVLIAFFVCVFLLIVSSSADSNTGELRNVILSGVRRADMRAAFSGIPQKRSSNSSSPPSQQPFHCLRLSDNLFVHILRCTQLHLSR